MSESHLDSEASGSETHARSPGLFLIAWRRKSLLLLGMAVGLLLGFLYYTQQPSVFESSARLLVIKKQNNIVPIQGMEGQQGFVEDYLSTHMYILKSPKIASRAWKKLEGKQLKTFRAGNPEDVLVASFQVARDDKWGSSPSSILNLSFRGPASDECPEILAALIDGYKDFLDETYRTGNQELLKEISGILKISAEQTKEAEAKYRKFEIAHEDELLPSLKEGGSFELKRLDDLQSRCSDNLDRLTQIDKALKRIEKAKQSKEDLTLLLPLLGESLGRKIHAGGGHDAQNYAAEDNLIKVKLELESKLLTLSSDHPHVQRLKRNVEMLEKLVANRVDRVDPLELSLSRSKPGAPLSEQVDELAKVLGGVEGVLQESREDLLVQVKVQRAKVSQLLKLEKERADLIQTIVQKKNVADLVAQKLNGVNLLQEVGGFKCEVLSPSTWGIQVAPKVISIFPLAALAGLLGGFALAYLAEFFDKSFRTPEEIRRRLGLPVMGHIPGLTADATTLARAQKEGNLLDATLCVHYRPKSSLAEAFRGIRTAIYFNARGSGHKVLQVTSPNKGDGKSTVIANLAVSIAQSGKSVLLLDADFRRPRQHKMFNVSGDVGLASVMCGTAELPDAIQSTCIPNLSVLPCGPRPSNPAELLTSPQFKEILDLLREQYDFVLIDTPPMLVVSDPSVVAPRVDAVILTIRVSKNGRPEAERAKEMLGALGVKILGVIVNGVGLGKGYGYSYGYKYTYNYKYSYGYGSYGGNGEGYYDEGPQENGHTNGKVPALVNGTPVNGNGHHAAEGNGAAEPGPNDVADVANVEEEDLLPPKPPRSASRGWFSRWWR